MNKYYLILIKQYPLEYYMTYRNRIYSDLELNDLREDITKILSSEVCVSDIKVIRGIFLPVEGLINYDKKEKEWENIGDTSKQCVDINSLFSENAENVE